MTSLFEIDRETLLFDKDVAVSVGARFHDEYVKAEPYPHICLDDALPPAVLDGVLADLPQRAESQDSYDRPQERNKHAYIPERLPMYTRQLFNALNSRHFLMFLENLTGIEGLLPDPYFAGAGIHEVGNGGHLDIHADFNHHAKLNLERRINVLIYLDKEWQEAYGGSFEIWDKAMTGKEKGFVPVFNRMVIFNTGSDTYHGNPEPVAHPESAARYSIALYYYTATWDDARLSHTTAFKPRPGSGDARRDFKELSFHLAKEITPPLIFRNLRKSAQRRRG